MSVSSGAPVAERLPAGKDKSSLYLAFLPLVLSGRVELLDLRQLFAELRNLVRRTRSAGPRGLFRPVNLRIADFCLRWFQFRRKLGEGKGQLAAVERDIAPYPVFIGNHPVGEGAHRFAVPQGDE